MVTLHRRLASLAFALLALAGPALAGVIVVDPAGGGDFTDAFAAVAAAAPGDTLLLVPYSGCVPPCEFDGFWVDGKSLTIVFDSPLGSAGAYHFPGIGVRNLLPGQRVVLRGLRSQAQGFFSGIWLEDNAGSVWIEDCLLTGGVGNGGVGLGGCIGPADVPGWGGIRARNCTDVTVVRCTLTGGRGSNAFFNEPQPSGSVIATDGGPALDVINSMVAVYESTLIAGIGGSGHLCFEVADGGPGVAAKTASRVFLSGCIVTGAAAGSGPPVGAPGPGLRGDATSSFELLDTSVTAAPGGIDFDTAPGAVFVYPGDARSFELPSPLREGESGTLAIAGVQSDFVAFFWSFGHDLLPKPGKNGWFLLGAPFVAGPFLIGAISDPRGIWHVPITGPNLPPAAEAQTFLLQAYFAHAGGVTLGSGTAFTLIEVSL